MDPDLHHILRAKENERKRLARLSAGEKLKNLDELRERSEIRRGKRVVAKLQDELTADSESVCGEAVVGTHRFPGRSPPKGVRYEVRIAAFLGVKMLVGSRARPWADITGGDIEAISLQGPVPVDDVLVELKGDKPGFIYISAKLRGRPITLGNNRTFRETVEDFVSQYRMWSPEEQQRNRLVWAVPSWASQNVLVALASALNAHGAEFSVDCDGWSDFLRRRTNAERDALEKIWAVLSTEWHKQCGQDPDDSTLRRLLSRMSIWHFDFKIGEQMEREVLEDLSRDIVANPSDAQACWEKIELIFLGADEHGLRVSRDGLHDRLKEAKFRLQSPPDYTVDVARLREVSEASLAGLERFTCLAFGRGPQALEIHLERTPECEALLAATKNGSLLVTGEPGIGKSGLLHTLAKRLPEELPVVCLLAEDLTAIDEAGCAGPPGLAHPVVQVLSHWPGDSSGAVIVDAVDAVRDSPRMESIYRLLETLRRQLPEWKLIVSVREHDLKNSHRLREAFPGEGVAGFAIKDFRGIAHFYLQGLSDVDLQKLAEQQPQMRPLLENAGRDHDRLAKLYRSPFCLSLAADLLSFGVDASQLADWNTPSLLLRRYWERRVTMGPGRAGRENVLNRVCTEMVSLRRTTLSQNALKLSDAHVEAISDLRQRGVLASPPVRSGSVVGEDRIQFAHHLLYDFVIAQTVFPRGDIPTLVEYLRAHPAVPVFFRLSYLFVLEELWDEEELRHDLFWRFALQLESEPEIHRITKIVAPTLAARRIRDFDELGVLWEANARQPEKHSAPHQLLRYLITAAFDVDAAILQESLPVWCRLAERMGGAVAEGHSDLAGLLGLLLERLLLKHHNPPSVTEDEDRLAINLAGRNLLAFYVSLGRSGGRRYAAQMAIEAIGQTFGASPEESRTALRTLITPERLASFPIDEMRCLAEQVEKIDRGDEGLVSDIFQAAFAREIEPGETEELGTPMLGLTMDRADLWNHVHYTLASYFEGLDQTRPRLAGRLVCVTWNGLIHERQPRRSHRGDQTPRAILARVPFRGHICELVEDSTEISGSSNEEEEHRILQHFERLVRSWAEGNDAVSLDQAVDEVAACNRTSLIWRRLFRMGAEFPGTLGVLLRPLLDEPVCLTHADYASAARTLFGTLHAAGGEAQRVALEQLILALPGVNPASDEGDQRVVNRLLGTLQPENLVLPNLMSLYREREAADAILRHSDRERFHVYGVSSRDCLRVREQEEGGDPTRKILGALTDRLSPFLREGDSFDVQQVEAGWDTLPECDAACAQYLDTHREESRELWGKLVGAAENLACRANWEASCERWQLIREILLRAAEDPDLRPDSPAEAARHDSVSYGIPAPRVDAAAGLLWIVGRLGHADEEVTRQLRRFCSDPSRAVRWNFAERVIYLHQFEADLMWELVDTIITEEPSFAVLEALAHCLDRLLGRDVEGSKARLRRIAERARNGGAPEDHSIHALLAQVFAFSYLQTGDVEGKDYVNQLVSSCEVPRVAHSLRQILLACRERGWLTISDDSTGEDRELTAMRERTWELFAHILEGAQEKLKQRLPHPRPDKNVQPTNSGAHGKAEIGILMRLTDSVANQIYCGSGALERRINKGDGRLTPRQLQQYWKDAAPVLRLLVREVHPHTVGNIVQTLEHLFACAPREVFLIAAESIRNGCERGGFDREPQARDIVVRLVNRALCDAPEIFRNAEDTESALIFILDRFVEAGWPEARELTSRLEEVFR